MEQRVIRSMTGFGDASSEQDGVHYFMEIRSLNNRYFKATIRMPDEFQGLEAELESELRRRINRGSVTVSGRCTDASERAAFEINHKALERYIQQARSAPSIANGDVSLDMAALMSLPGVLQAPADEESRIGLAREMFRTLLAECCEHLVAMRHREGMLLVEELRSHAEYIRERLEKIAVLAPRVVSEYEARLRTRVDALLKESKIDLEPGEFVREIAIYAEKTDIAEEISRLSGHIAQFNDLIAGDDDRPVGRTLDFLSQEMLREANTIASKTPDGDVSRLIVEVKGAIDRIKEQAQNVE
jgi:uncharacterized protein (TIGR00255 family)